MRRTTLDTPTAVVQALNDDGAILPPRTQCDVFSKAEAKVQCMVCTAPAMKRTEPQVVVVLMGATRHEQREAATVLQRLIGDGPDSPASLRLLQTGGVTLMLAPWSARELVRGVIDSVSSSWNPERVTVDGAQVQTEGVVVVPGPGSQGDVAVEIRHSLESFAGESGSLWSSARRLLSGKEEPRHWTLPLGCSVTERVEGKRVCWDVTFEEVGKLERAVELVQARLDMRKDRLLERWSDHEDDAVETRMPSITVTAPSHSREARAEMARLLQNVLFLVGRLGFVASGPADLRNSAGQPG